MSGAAVRASQLVGSPQSPAETPRFVEDRIGAPQCAVARRLRPDIGHEALLALPAAERLFGHIRSRGLPV